MIHHRHWFFEAFHRIPNHRPLIWLVTLLNYISGIILILDPRVGQVTGYKFLGGAQAALSGLCLITAAGMASLALVLEHVRGRPTAGTFWLLMPQQIVLVLVAVGSGFAVFQGHYTSGTVLPRAFIFVDQLPKIMLALFYPFALLAMHLPILPEGVAEEAYGDG